MKRLHAPNLMAWKGCAHQTIYLFDFVWSFFFRSNFNILRSQPHSFQIVNGADRKWKLDQKHFASVNAHRKPFRPIIIILVIYFTWCHPLVKSKKKKKKKKQNKLKRMSWAFTLIVRYASGANNFRRPVFTWILNLFRFVRFFFFRLFVGPPLSWD